MWLARDIKSPKHKEYILKQMHSPCSTGDEIETLIRVDRYGDPVGPYFSLHVEKKKPYNKRIISIKKLGLK